MSDENAQKSRYLIGAGIIAGCVILYVISISFRDFWYPDEPDIARVIQEMIWSGDWMHPTLLGRSFASYPPMFYWLAGVSSMMGKLNEFWIRLPSVIASGFLLLIVYVWTRRKFGLVPALWAAYVLGTSYLYMNNGVRARVDMSFAAFFGAAICVFDITGEDKEGLNAVGILGCGILMGMASLTKGPLGFLLPGFILSIHIVWQRRWIELRDLALAGVIACCIFAAWSLAYSDAAGADDLFHFLWEQNVARFAESDSHERPLYYYVINLPLDLLPWSPFLVGALAEAWKRKKDRGYNLLFVWFVAGFVFFSLASSKRSVYLLPLLPSAGVLIGTYFTKYAGQKSKLILWTQRVFAILFPLVGVLLSVGLPLSGMLDVFARTIYVPIGLVALIFISGGIAIKKFLASGNTGKSLAVNGLVSAVTLCVIYAILMPIMDDPLSARKDGQLIRRYSGNASCENVAVYAPGGELPEETSAIAFYGRLKIQEITKVSQVSQYWAKHPDGLLLVDPEKWGRVAARCSSGAKLVKDMVIGSDGIMVLRSVSFRPEDNNHQRAEPAKAE